MKDILTAVSRVTGVPESDIVGANQTMPITEARFLFYKVGKDKSYPQNALGIYANKVRSSVFHLLAKYEPKLDTDSGLAEKYSEVYKALGEPPIEGEIDFAPIWNESFYILDASSRYFGKYFIGMENNVPICFGSRCKVVNEMIDRKK